MATNPEFLSHTLLMSVFQVPLYQRGYSWRNQHVEELLKDIGLCDIGNVPVHHFINSFIAKKVADLETDEAHRPVYELTDGQQRMTTLYLILTRLYHKMEELGAEPEELSGLERRLWVTPIAQPRVPRLTFDENSRQHFWNELITQLNPAPTFSSEHRLVDAVETIDLFLEDFTLPELKVYKRKIFTGCSCVLVDYSQSHNGGDLNLNEHTVFATLNSRGLNVAPFDMIKNLGLMIKNSNGNHVNANFMPARTWKNVLIFLDSKDAEKMEVKMVAAYYRTIENDNDIDKKGNNLYEQFYKKYSSLQFPLIGQLTPAQTLLFTEIQDFFSNLEDYAKSYVSIFQSQYTKPVANPNAAHLDKVGKCNRLLTEINHKNGLGMTLLNDILICSHSKYTINEFIPILEKISPILIRIYSGTGSKRVDHQVVSHLGAAHGIWNGTLQVDTLTYLCNFLSDIQNKGSLNEFILRLHSDIGKDAYSWTNITYFLFEHEMSLNPAWNQSRLTLGQKIRTTEHIMPNTWMPVQYWRALYTQQENAIGNAMVKRLGNLVLTGDNTVLSNRPFPQKRDGLPPGTAPYYSHAMSLKGEHFVASLGNQNWKRHQIAVREIFLLWFAFHRWKTNCPCDLGVDFSLPQELLVTFGIDNMQGLIDIISDLEDTISEYLPEDGDRSFTSLVQRLNDIVQEEE